MARYIGVASVMESLAMAQAMALHTAPILFRSGLGSEPYT